MRSLSPAETNKVAALYTVADIKAWFECKYYW